MVAELPEAQDFGVWEENAETLEVFISLSTQWRINPMSNRVQGLEYGALAAVLDIYQVQDKRAVFQDLRAMEIEFIRAANNGK